MYKYIAIAISLALVWATNAIAGTPVDLIITVPKGQVYPICTTQDAAKDLLKVYIDEDQPSEAEATNVLDEVCKLSFEGGSTFHVSELFEVKQDMVTAHVTGFVTGYKVDAFAVLSAESVQKADGAAAK